MTSKKETAKIVRNQRRQLYQVVGELEGRPSFEKVTAELKRRNLDFDKEAVRRELIQMAHRKKINKEYDVVAEIVRDYVVANKKFPTCHAVCQTMRKNGLNPSFIEVRHNIELAAMDEEVVANFLDQEELKR